MSVEQSYMWVGEGMAGTVREFTSITSIKLFLFWIENRDVLIATPFIILQVPSSAHDDVVAWPRNL